jgi:hypothetical protein
MRRLIFGALALSSAAGCAGTTGSSDAQISSSGGGGSGPTVQVNLDGGGAPAVPPDGAAACPGGVCNYQTGKGCSGATSACVPAGTPITPVCLAPGAAGPSAPCVQVTDCIAGYACGGGTCHKLCCGGDWTGCNDPNEHCIVGLNEGNAPTGAMLCYPVNTCDALTPSSCTQPGTSCVIVDPTGATACIGAGTGQAGQPCPCAGGFLCIQPPMGGAPTCARLCKAVEGGGAPYCQPNEGICTHYTRDPAGVGECQPPM